MTYQSTKTETSRASIKLRRFKMRPFKMRHLPMLFAPPPIPITGAPACRTGLTVLLMMIFQRKIDNLLRINFHLYLLFPVQQMVNPDPLFTC